MSMIIEWLDLKWKFQSFRAFIIPKRRATIFGSLSLSFLPQKVIKINPTRVRIRLRPNTVSDNRGTRRRN